MMSAAGRRFLLGPVRRTACLRHESTAAQKLGKLLPGAWRKTYEATNQTELIDAYSDWAETYDKDSIGHFGYSAPEVAAKTLATYVQPNASVLDLGAGTGLVGEFLAKEGFTQISALDLSPEMLAVARKKKCYHEILQMDAENIDIVDNHYDAGISVGTFTPNHIGLKALNEFIRIVRPGGIICLSLRDDFVADVSNGFKDHLDTLEHEKKMERLHVTPVQVYTQKVSEEITFRCWMWIVR
jgi:ubiquinone/menaquinone biosynthesis C-methylase UbiE